MIDLLNFVAYGFVIYGFYGIFKGEIYSKDGMSGRYVYKSEEPISFWVVCCCYIFIGIFIVFTLKHKYG